MDVGDEFVHAADDKTLKRVIQRRRQHRISFFPTALTGTMGMIQI